MYDCIAFITLNFHVLINQPINNSVFFHISQTVCRKEMVGGNCVCVCVRGGGGWLTQELAIMPSFGSTATRATRQVEQRLKVLYIFVSNNMIIPKTILFRIHISILRWSR